MERDTVRQEVAYTTHCHSASDVDRKSFIWASAPRYQFPFRKCPSRC